MALTVRPAVPEDVDELAELAASAFRAAYGATVPSATIEAVVAQACTTEAFRGLLDRPAPSRLLVAEDGGLQAFLDFAEEPDGFELRRLYTRPGLTSRGIGTALLDALEAGLPAGTAYRIVVVAHNTRGLAFWQRHGFVMEGEVDSLAHFTSHRSVAFSEETAPVPSYLMVKRIPG